MPTADARSREIAWPRLLALLVAITAAAFVAALLVGPAGLFGQGAIEAEARRLILTEIRLPRAILATLIGAGLGMAGAALQGYLRNPLAEPGLVGISGGAVLGAVMAIHTGLAATFALALPLAGLAGAGLAAATVLGLGGLAGGPLTLILAGVAVTSLTGALTSLALNLSANPFAATEIVFWMLGSLTDRSLTHVWLAAPFILAGLVVLATTAPGLDALTLGDDVAASLGVDGRNLALRVVTGTALAVGAGVAVAGTIGFVGLVIPHLLRPLVGHLPGRLLTASALGGAALVLLADVTVRLVPSVDLKLGVLTALIGAPFFAWLVIATRRELGP